MNTKILITAITITAATMSAGSYYLTANYPQSPAQQAAAETIATDGTPIQVAVNHDNDKPLTIVVKTEVTEKQRRPINTGHIRDLKQPNYGVLDSNGLPISTSKP
jgi:hypothetical protein